MRWVPPSAAAPKPVVAALLSALVPGAGQWYGGDRRRAVWFAAPFAVIVVFGVWLALRGRVGLVVLLVQPAWIVSLTILNLGVAALRVAAAVDAYRSVGGQWRGKAAVSTAAVVLVLMAPHLVLGVYAADLLSLLSTVFVTDEGVRSAAAQSARYRGMPDAIPPTVAAEDRGSILVLADGVLVNQPDGIQRRVTPAFGGLPSPAFSPFEDEFSRFTVLLAGGDAGPGRSGLRTDVVIVASLDLATDRAVLFSISRELVGFPMPSAWDQLFESREELFWGLHRDRDLAGTSQATDPAPEVFEPQGIWPDRINAVYPFATGVVDRYYPDSPDPAMEALTDTVQLALGIPIPFWVLVDMEGFVDLVDAIGGVEVNALEPMHVTFSPEREGAEDITIDIEPGRQLLDGRLALAYVRNRSDSDDFVRTRRQRCMLREVASSVDPVTILTNFGSIADAIRDHTTTNIPLRLLPEAIEAVGELDRSGIVTMAFQAGSRHAPDSNYRGLRIIDVDATRATVDAVFDDLAAGTVIEPGEDECS